MIPQTMPIDDLEQVYDMIADAVDEVGPENECVFLAKLALVLSSQVNDPAKVEAAVIAARRGQF